MYAVPGRVTDTGSAGCNNLIKMGAMCVTSSEDILEELGIQTVKGQFLNKNYLHLQRKKCIVVYVWNQDILMIYVLRLG